MQSRPAAFAALRPTLSLGTLVLALGLALLAPPGSSQTLHWSRWPMPAARNQHVAVYDPARERMLVYGGLGPGQDGFCGDTWALELSGTPRWHWVRHDANPPLECARAAAVVDSIGGCMLMVGGDNDGVPLSGTSRYLLANDVWSFAGFSGSQPAAGTNYTAVLDVLRRRMLLFGKDGAAATPAYQLDLATSAWSTLATNGTPPGGTAAAPPYPAAYDIARDRLVVIGNGGLWQLTLSVTPTWSTFATVGTPPASFSGTLIYDFRRDRMVFVGNGGEVHALSLTGTSTWTSIAIPPLPTGTHLPRTIYDTHHDRIIWFGSNTGLNDTWAFSLATSQWSLFEPGSPIPLRERPNAVAVPPLDAMLVFGGGSNTTWRYPLNGGGVFTPVATTGPLPSSRTGAAAIYDPLRQRMLVFGGNDGALKNDVHALSLAGTPTWAPLAATGTPPSPREQAHAIYDPLRDRMVVFGGGGSTRDAWALSLAGTPEWTQLTLATDLPEIITSVAVYESRRDRLVAIGDDYNLGQTRAFWTPLGAPGTWTAYPGGLSEINEFAAEYDSSGDRVLLHGGIKNSGTSIQGGLYQLDTATGAWAGAPVAGQTPLPRCFHTMVRDPLRNTILLYGGREADLAGANPFTGTYLAPSVWHLSSTYSLGVDPGARPPGGSPSFARLALIGRARIAFELVLSGDEPAIVEAFDITGRRLGRVEVGASSTARTGELALARRLPAGVCLVRVRQGGRAAVRRLVAL